ncbi:hypothetical protein Cgig2_028335 [Carnegiea gigantea]|uniref:Uncharacterized protein n=1 Tax=Carnegiea gigantea TaxID=171969 RepID=A0A9Q1KKA8_9CARY|nr:hypothetical protein Cgig2_028335 [Carnegiea gigantea]
MESGCGAEKRDHSDCGDMGLRSKSHGALGIRNVETWNLGSLGRYAWSISNKTHTLWVRWVNHVYLRTGNRWNCKAASGPSWSWRQITKIKELLTLGYDVQTGRRMQCTDGTHTIANGYKWFLRDDVRRLQWPKAVHKKRKTSITQADVRLQPRVYIVKKVQATCSILFRAFAKAGFTSPGWSAPASYSTFNSS